MVDACNHSSEELYAELSELFGPSIDLKAPPLLTPQEVSCRKWDPAQGEHFRRVKQCGKFHEILLLF